MSQPVRQMRLVRRCEEILHDADVEAAGQALGYPRLAHHLGRVCAAAAEALRCAEVSIHLGDPASAEPGFPLVATSAPGGPPAPPIVAGAGPAGEAVAKGVPVTAGGVTAAPIMGGDSVWGVVVCAGTAPAGPDPELVAPVTPQIARYWNGWLQRRTIVAENESWRQLAAGLTELNELLSDQLNRRAPDDGAVFRTAVEVVRRVVPDCTGGAVWRSTAVGADRRLLLASAPGPATPPGDRIAPAAAEWALRTRQQRATTERAEIARDGIDPDAGWLVHTPLWASHRRYGVLEISGAAAVLPANSLQACRIVGDQLGLYLHLRQTLHHLQDTRATLRRTIRSQAEALEDLEHQLVSPLLAATNASDRVLHARRLDGRTEQQLRAVRGLCRKSSRVALSAGVFAALSNGKALRPKLERLYADDLLRVLIAAADDAQLLNDPRRGLDFAVERDSVRALGRSYIQADRSFLEQCVSNLVDNAAKYSYNDTRVELGGRAEDGTFAVSVRNLGLALDREERDRCLERNWRGAAARNATGEGSGLGLWIVDHLMRCMKGRVRISADADTTTVLLSFPVI